MQKQDRHKINLKMVTAPPAHPPRALVIASRQSRLARRQAEQVRDALQTLYPQANITLLGVTTRGDRMLDQPLSKIGGKALFVKELENALADGRADLAVHSLKDVPMELPPGFTLAAVPERADARDALVARHFSSLDALPPASIVGTSSLRREAMVRARYPQLNVQPLRGNLDTRLRKLDAGKYAAIIVAAAGLIRLKLAQRIRAIFEPRDSLPAAGQGALGIEIRADRNDVAHWLAPLHHSRTGYAVRAERAALRALGGNCETPLAAFAAWEDEQLCLRASAASPDGKRILRAQRQAMVDTAAAAAVLGRLVADDLARQGAHEIMRISA